MIFGHLGHNVGDIIGGWRLVFQIDISLQDRAVLERLGIDDLASG